MVEFEHIVSSYKDQVFNTCLSIVKNYEDAEDLAQEVFVKVYLKLPAFRHDSSLKTWIYRITVNKCLQYLRSNKTQKRKGINVELSEHEEPVGFDHPGVTMENKELAKMLFAVMDMLPENQRVAFTLHKVENLSHEEIAQVLDKSVSSIESLIHRAKQNLRDLLKKYQYENYR